MTLLKVPLDMTCPSLGMSKYVLDEAIVPEERRSVWGGLWGGLWGGVSEYQVC